jgi:hypothetical protein
MRLFSSPHPQLLVIPRLITIARTTHVTAITVTPMNIVGTGGTGRIIATTTIGITIGIDAPS